MAEAQTHNLTAVEVFDSVGAAYEDAFNGLATQEASLQWLLAQLPASGGAKILDIGCGTGRPVASVLADAGHDVLGIDISPAMLEAARERVPNARFELIDVRPFLQRELRRAAQTAGANRLDAVTVYFSLIADVSQDDIRRVLADVGCLLKPGGTLVFATVPIPANNEAIRWMGRPVVISSLGPVEAAAAVRAAGLDIVSCEQTQFKPRSAEVGICRPEDVWEEQHLFIYAKKPLK